MIRKRFLIKKDELFDFHMEEIISKIEISHTRNLNIKNDKYVDIYVYFRLGKNEKVPNQNISFIKGLYRRMISEGKNSSLVSGTLGYCTFISTATLKKLNKDVKRLNLKNYDLPKKYKKILSISEINDLREFVDAYKTLEIFK